MLICMLQDKTDAKKILTTSPLGELEVVHGMDEDYQTGHDIQQLSGNEAMDVAQNHPLWRLIEQGLTLVGSSTLETDVYVWRYALLVVHDRKEKDMSLRRHVAEMTDNLLSMFPIYH